MPPPSAPAQRSPARGWPAFGSTSQRAVSAAAAGMDLILCAAQEVSQSETATAALASAFTSGQLSPATFNAAAGRVTALRASLF